MAKAPEYEVTMTMGDGSELKVGDMQIKTIDYGPKNILIFGVTGQDGSYLSELLLGKGHKVYGVARRTSNGNTSRISHLLSHKNFSLLSGDITDFGSVLNMLRTVCPNRIYNLAAQSHVGTSFTHACSSLDITAKGVVNILEAIRFLKGELPKDVRMYQASSSEMFGDSYSSDGPKPIGYTIEGNLVYKDQDGNLVDRVSLSNSRKYQDESTPFNPQSPYAIAKLTAHKYCGLYRKAYGIDVRCGILFNHESERRGEEFVTRKITKYLGRLSEYLVHASKTSYPSYRDFLVLSPFKSTSGISVERKIVENAPKLNLGNLDVYRDWGHAKDYVSAMYLIMEADNASDYVVATGETHSIKDFLKEAFMVANVGDWKEYVNIDDSLKRPAEVPYLCGDSSRIREELGWNHTIGFKELVKRMVKADVRT